MHITTVMEETEWDFLGALDLHSASFVTHDDLLELGEGEHFGDRELFFRHTREADQLLKMNVLSKLQLGLSKGRKQSAKPMMVGVPVAHRKRYQKVVTPQWAGNASLFFLRWENVFPLRESKSMTSRTIFTMMQTSAGEAVP